MKKGEKILFLVALTAIFSAMTFALTFVSVPLPTGAKVHLGNFACVLAGLLCGGVVGGIAGSLGMGLNDIVSGYGWNTTVRTFIVKFILGFAVGTLFRLLLKKDKAAKITLYSMTGLSVVGFITTLVLYATGSEVLNKDGSVKSFYTAQKITIGEATKTAETSILVPIFLGVLSLVLIGLIVLILVLTKKGKEKGKIYNVVGTVSAISVVVNTIGEFFLRWLLNGIYYNSSETGLAESISKIPANILTGVVTIVAVTLIYLPVYQALKHVGYEKYLINSDKLLKAEEEKSLDPENSPLAE